MKKRKQIKEHFEKIMLRLFVQFNGHFDNEIFKYFDYLDEELLSITILSHLYDEFCNENS